MAKFNVSFDAAGDVWEFSGSIHLSEIASLRLDHIDKVLLDAGAETAADALLILEMIYRRLAQQRKIPANPVKD